MGESFTQLHLGDWEHGLAKPIALLALEPGEISERTGLKFETTRDELDYLQAALFRTSGGTQFALARHQHAPIPGTEIVVNERTNDLSAALEEAISVLGFDVTELVWVHPEIA
jgi:hypothetical protein